ncbi:MAG TPA: hypothetical protein VGC94_00895 [Amnibacterium sp.]
MAGVRVRLLGRPAVEAGDGAPPAHPRGRKTWALLARIALADRPVARAELAHALFPEADDPLGALRWSLADLRRALGSPDVARGDPLSVDRAALELDVWDLEDGVLPPAPGALLDGVDLRDCPDFDGWLVLARARCEHRLREALRAATLGALSEGDLPAALDVAERAARLDPLDEAAQELFLRTLVAAGRPAVAAAHLAVCERAFAREGLPLSPAVRLAAAVRAARPSNGIRAGIAAASLLQAGTAALAAGAADGGVETLRRAADDAARAGDPGLHAEVLAALGAALVHAVRGADGEGAVVLHQALHAARVAGRDALAADVLRELAFVDLQAGRHGSASRALDEAVDVATPLGDDALEARILAVQGMNEADLGHHAAGAALLERSAETAGRAGADRQRVWSLGVLARSLLLLDRVDDARAAAAASMAGARAQRWNAYLPWPQALHAECDARRGDWRTAEADAEAAFALACELGDPCWEGMAARALGLIAVHGGDPEAGWSWTLDARVRCDRVPDRYVWVSGYVGLAQLEITRRTDPAALPDLAARLHAEALRDDLPEFQAWAAVHAAEAGHRASAGIARAAATGVDSPGLHRRIRALRA